MAVRDRVLCVDHLSRIRKKLELADAVHRLHRLAVTRGRGRLAFRHAAHSMTHQHLHGHPDQTIHLRPPRFQCPRQLWVRHPRQARRQRQLRPRFQTVPSDR